MAMVFLPLSKSGGAQILSTSFSTKEALGISTLTPIQLSLGERLNLLLTLSGLTKTTTDIEKGRYEPPFFYMRIMYGVENFN